MRHRLLVPLWNADERRLRAAWRLLLFGVVLVLSFAGLGLAVGRLPPAVVVALERSLPPALVGSVVVRRAVEMTVVGLLVTGLVAAAAVVVDRRPLAAYGLSLDRDWWLDCGFGLALGAALMTLVFAVESAAGWVVVRDTLRAPGPLPFAGALLAALVLFLAVGFVEELLLRGYVLTNAAEGFRAVGDRAAVALAVLGSSALFGALHAANPNATAVSTVAVGLGGVLLALGYVLTGDLAIPVGLHVTWNFFQGPVYGFPVSGIDAGVSVVVLSQRGPPAATGGAFGPEAGLVGVGAMVVGAAAIVGYVRRRHGPLALAPITVPRLRRRTDAADAAGGRAVADERRGADGTAFEPGETDGDDEAPAVEAAENGDDEDAG